ncbi:MAG TPA: hypothetical protein VFV34_02600 [Blastocatellia bacterium]|nr:hypothetical protein [Blastocatellia bacterium]
MYSRRQFGEMMLAGLPLSLVLRHINSKFKGVQIGAITYSFRSMPATEIIPAMVKLGLSEAELMSNHCEALAGVPQGAGFGGPRGQVTPEQQEARRRQQEALSKWRMSTSPDIFKAVKKKFNDAGIDVPILCFNQRMTATDDEIEYAFQMARALGVKRSHRVRR